MAPARFARTTGPKRAFAVLALSMATQGLAAPALRCALEAPAQAATGTPVMLRFTLTNAGAVPLQVLRWNTPLEGAWFARFVEVTHDGRALPFAGPMMKRGDPRANAYLRLEPGASATGEVDLALPFDLSKPGVYHVQPRIRLVDVFDAGRAQPPRPRSAHEGADLDCPAVDVTIAG
jgi:hypothetical protein